MRTFTPCIGLKPNGFVFEASRETGTVIINSLALVETLMDSVSLQIQLAIHFSLVVNVIDVASISIKNFDVMVLIAVEDLLNDYVDDFTFSNPCVEVLFLFYSL
jgi:hypothetical protein